MARQVSAAVLPILFVREGLRTFDIYPKTSQKSESLMNVISDTVAFKKGSMTKLPSEMSASELKTWQEQGEKEIRAYLFSINQPLIYRKNGFLVAEYRNGGIEVLE